MRFPNFVSLIVVALACAPALSCKPVVPVVPVVPLGPGEQSEACAELGKRLLLQDRKNWRCLSVPGEVRLWNAGTSDDLTRMMLTSPGAYGTSVLPVSIGNVSMQETRSGNAGLGIDLPKILASVGLPAVALPLVPNLSASVEEKSLQITSVTLTDLLVHRIDNAEAVFTMGYLERTVQCDAGRRELKSFCSELKPSYIVDRVLMGKLQITVAGPSTFEAKAKVGWSAAGVNGELTSTLNRLFVLTVEEPLILAVHGMQVNALLSEKDLCTAPRVCGMDPRIDIDFSIFSQRGAPIRFRASEPVLLNLTMSVHPARFARFDGAMKSVDARDDDTYPTVGLEEVWLSGPSPRYRLLPSSGEARLRVESGTSHLMFEPNCMPIVSAAGSEEWTLRERRVVREENSQAFRVEAVCVNSHGEERVRGTVDVRVAR